MNVKLVNNTSLSPIIVTGGSRFVQGANRDTLDFIFPATEDMAELDSAFSTENCESITIVSDDGTENIHKGYTIRAELSKKAVEVAPATEEAEATYEDRITISMSQRTYTETELSKLTTRFPNTLEGQKNKRISQSKIDLANYLENHPLTWVDGNQYSATSEKQSLLTSQLALYQTAVAAGQSYALKWNTSGGVCTEWTYDDLASLAFAIGQYVQPLVSYQQQKEVELNTCTTIDEVNAIVIDYDTLY